MTKRGIKIFALQSGRPFAEKVCAFLDIPLAKHEERDFEDGEHKIRTLENVRNKKVFVVQSLYSDGKLSVNDQLCHLLFFISELKESVASKVTAIIPYLCYSRKDRKTQPRDPVTTKYLAKLLESAGADHVVSLDIHNLQAFQNSFRCSIDHLEAKKVFSEYILQEISRENLAIMSPDSGGIKRAEALKETLEKMLKTELPLVFMEKRRSFDVLSGESLIGNVAGKNVVIIDDLISSGSTLLRSAIACKKAGAEEVQAFVTHGVYSSKAHENLQHPALDKLVVTNSLPIPKNMKPLIEDGKIKVLDIAPLIAECIKRLVNGESLNELSGNL